MCVCVGIRRQLANFLGAVRGNGRADWSIKRTGETLEACPRPQGTKEENSCRGRRGSWGTAGDVENLGRRIYGPIRQAPLRGPRRPQPSCASLSPRCSAGVARTATAPATASSARCGPMGPNGPTLLTLTLETTFVSRLSSCVTCGTWYTACNQGDRWPWWSRLSDHGLKFV